MSWPIPTFSALRLYSVDADEPITLTEAKAQAYVTTEDDNDLLNAMISAARKMVETRTGRSLPTQTWDLWLDSWPADDVIVLPTPPAASVTHVKYYDTDGTQQTITATNYQVDSDTEPGIIVPVKTYEWPTLYDMRNPITVRFVCGYGDPEDVPQCLKAAIKMLVHHMYEYRGPVMDEATPHIVPDTVDALITPYITGVMS